MDRRKFGTTVLGAALAATAATPRTAAAATSGLELVGAPHVKFFRDAADSIWAHDNKHGSGAALGKGLTHYRQAQALLDRARCDDRTGRELASATGELAMVSAWLAFDSENQDEATRCYTAALKLAVQSHDDDLMVNVLDGMRLQAWRLGNRPEALQLSRRASDRVYARRESSNRLQALFAAREAVAHAAVGDTRECQRALTRAAREVDRGIDNPDDPLWMHFVTPTEIQFIEAQAMMFLDQHDKAITVFRDAVDAAEGCSLRDEASYRAYLASALAQQGDTSNAVTEGLSALTLLEDSVKSPRLVAEMRTVRATTRGTHSGDTATFNDRFDALRAVAA